MSVNALAKYVQDNVSKWCKLQRAGSVTQMPWLQQEGAGELTLAKLKSSKQAKGEKPKEEISSARTGGQEPAKPEVTPVTKAGKHFIYTEWPFGETEAKRRQKESAEILGIPSEYAEDLGKGVLLKMVLIPAGEFIMGSPEDEQDRNDNEGPQHRVRLTAPFYMGKYEVTEVEWKMVMGGRPKDYHGDQNYGYSPRKPIQNAEIDEIFAFITKLNETSKRSKSEAFALPTEAQWEYACRAGTNTRFYWGDDPEYKEIHKFADLYGDLTLSKQSVGLKKANAWELFDMTGGVPELCRDFYAEYIGDGEVTDPIGPEEGETRVRRG